MKYAIIILCLIFVLGLLSSCYKKKAENKIIVDHFTYQKKLKWREDSTRVNKGDWQKIEKGNVFSWLLQSDDLQRPSVFATYDHLDNIKTGFIYTISTDSVFLFRQSSGIIYFPDKDGKNRTDIEGQLSFTPDTTLVLNNNSVTPGFSIKYKIER